MTTPDAPTSGGKSLDFTKKVGPFPLFVWVAAVGVIGYLYWRSRSAASAASAAQTGTGTTDSAGSPLTDQSGGVGAGAGGWAYQPPAATTPTASTITDNNSWAQSAEQYLLALNYNPALVDSAIRDYISGNTLQANEWAIITQALKGVGPLPTPLPGAGPPPIVNPIVPTPPKTPAPPQLQPWGTVGGHVSPTAGWGVTGPKAPAPRTYTVKSGDTLWAIAQKYYGNGADYPKIAAANHIANPNLIYPGTVLTIP